MSNITNDFQLNHLQFKLLEKCNKKGLSVEETFAELQTQRDLCKKIMEHADDCFARKVWKKSCMVTVNYGGSQRTSAIDVISQLKEMESSFIYECSPAEINMFTNMVFWSLETGVPSAMRFLNYFRKLLAFVLKYKDSVFFIHPMSGFPVCLRVYDVESKAVSYKVAGKTVSARINKKLSTTNKRKTTTSSVPGVIHSTDAGILMALKGGLMDNDVAFIHDSVGVHPNNIRSAKDAVTEALTLCMEADVFQNIYDQLVEGIPVEDIPEALRAVPYEGTWETWEDDVEMAEYAFS